MRNILVMWYWYKLRMRGDVVLQLLRQHRDEWLVLDRRLTVLDRGSDLGPLRARWAGRSAVFLHTPS